MKKKLLIGLGSILCLTLAGACAPAPVEEAPSPTGEAAPIKEKTMATSTIPADVSYEVIDTYILPGIKRQLDVRLNKKVSEDILRAIALELKSNDSRQYDRTFICYYLPDMVVDAGAWATTHFDPTLEIRIIGLSIQEEQALMGGSTPQDAEVIGIWIDDWTSSRITIYQENGSLYMEQVFSDGSSRKEELVENSSTLGRRFNMKEKSIDYFIIDSEGNLQLRDNLGLISTAKRI